MYQLYHSVPVVWRSDRCVQFGIDEPILIDGLTPPDTELVSVLRMGIGVDDFFDRAAHLGVSAARASSLLALLDEAGALVPIGPRSTTRLPTVHVDPVAATLGIPPAQVAETLTAAPVLVSGPFARQLLPVLVAAGFEASPIDRVEDAAAHRSPVVVLTGVWVEDAVSAACLVENGITHQQVVVGQSGATISHVVVPGVTPCTRCRVLRRTDGDADWFLAWRSLWRQAPQPARTDPVLGTLAMAHAALVLRSHLLGGRPVPVDAVVTLPDGAVTETEVEFHDACDCRIPVAGTVDVSA